MEVRGPISDAVTRLALLEAVSRGAPIVISAYDLDGRILVHEGAGVTKLGLQPGQLVGARVQEAFAGADDALRRIAAAAKGETSTNTQDLGETVWDNWFGPLLDPDGAIIGAVSISTDVTERERVRAELEARLAIIEAQTQAIRSMSSPIIQVWQDVLVLPVVGELDEARAARMTEDLLAALVSSRARHAILDLTGVETIDTRTADDLLRIVGSVRLLGVQCIVSGIRPAVAETLVQLGVDLARVVTVATLHAALRMCMTHQQATRPNSAQ
jgi:rsbT co-antagonist protein RsbR